MDCYQQMNYAYQGRQPPAKLAAIASAANPSQPPASWPTQTTWISDSGATDHFTLDINNLPDCSSYTNSQQVFVGNGQQLPISNIGNAQLYTFSYLFNLKKLLHVPSMASHLLSVNRFCCDNNCVFYFDADIFRIQDRPTGKPLYTGLSKDGLYSIYGYSFRRVHP